MSEDKRSVGRPTKYKDEYYIQVEKLCKLGATDKEIAEFFDVDEATINRWKIDHIEFCESIKKGKTLADAEVASKLYHRATGYEHPETDIRVLEGQITKTEITKHYPPDTTAAIFWLKNRQPQTWRDKVTQEITGKDGGAIKVDSKQDLSSLSDEELELYERLATLRSERDKAREG